MNCIPCKFSRNAKFTENIFHFIHFGNDFRKRNLSGCTFLDSTAYFNTDDNITGIGITVGYVNKITICIPKFIILLIKNVNFILIKKKTP